MSRKWNIAMFGHKRVPSREGGVEIVVEELSVRLVQAGHSVCCYNRKGHHVSGAQFDQNRLSSYKGVQIKDVFTIEKKGLAAVTSSFFASIAAAFGRYDVVHIHAEGPAAFCWLPKLFGKRVIVTVHGIDHQREKWRGGFAAKYILMGEKCAVRFADEIIVLSEGVRRYFEERYGRRTVFIPNGVSRPDPKQADLIRKQYGLEKDGYILFLGRIVPEKGLRYLVEAFQNTQTDKKLVIAGGASDSDDFMQEIQMMAAGDERILFTGFVQGRLLEELYSNAYVYTLPSDLEGMPLTLLEAMSYGSCCLISDIDECAGVTGDKAVIFRRGDVQDLQKKLQYLCDHPQQVMGYKADSSDYICSKYSWDDAVERTLALYQRHGEEK